MISDEELLRRLKKVMETHPDGGVHSVCAAYNEGLYCCIDEIAAFDDNDIWDDKNWSPS